MTMRLIWIMPLLLAANTALAADWHRIARSDAFDLYLDRAHVADKGHGVREFHTRQKFHRTLQSGRDRGVYFRTIETTSRAGCGHRTIAVVAESLLNAHNRRVGGHTATAVQVRFQQVQPKTLGAIEYAAVCAPGKTGR